MKAAKTALTEIINDARSRHARWSRLQTLLGFSLTSDAVQRKPTNGKSVTISGKSAFVVQASRSRSRRSVEGAE